MRRERAPEIALALGALLTAAGAAVVGWQTTGVILDETLFKASAVHYASGLPDSFFHDLTARATTRLYSLTLMPIYAAFDGDTALQVAKVWNALLFASAALPAYLLARMVIVSRWRAVACALLCVAIPWLTLSTALFSESLAYPVALWLFHAIARAMLAPSPRRDLAVLVWLVVATIARVQLVALAAGYAGLLIVAAALAGAAAPPGERLRGAWARVRTTPFTLAVLGGVLAVVLARAASGDLSDDVDRLVGAYGEFQRRGAVPTDVPLGGLVEVISLALGMGLVPVIVALAWYPAALRDRGDGPAWALAATAVAAVASIWAFVLAAQNGFIGAVTEERYFMYVAPFAWIATFAALERPRARSMAIAWAGGVVAVLFGTIALPYALNHELFLAPAGKTVSHLAGIALEDLRDVIGKEGLAARDLLFVVSAAVAVAVGCAWRRAPWLRRWLVGGAAAAQLSLTAYCFLALDGQVASGAADRTTAPSGDERAWIDKAAGGRDVTWLQNASWSDANLTVGTLRDAAFWNDDFRRRAGVAALAAPGEQSPVDALPLTLHEVDATGRFTPELGAGPMLVWTASPFLQVRGSRLADDSYGQPFELVEPQAPVRATWLATGMRPDGAVLGSTPATLQIWPEGRGALVAFELAPPAAGGGRVRVVLGDRSAVVRLAAGSAPQSVVIAACGDRVAGRLEAQRTSRERDGTRVAAILRSVRLRGGAPCQ